MYKRTSQRCSRNIQPKQTLKLSFEKKGAEEFLSSWEYEKSLKFSARNMILSVKLDYILSERVVKK